MMKQVDKMVINKLIIKIESHIKNETVISIYEGNYKSLSGNERNKRTTKGGELYLNYDYAINIEIHNE